jgi:hypothetical protein
MEENNNRIIKQIFIDIRNGEVMIWATQHKKHGIRISQQKNNKAKNMKHIFVHKIHI